MIISALRGNKNQPGSTLIVVKAVATRADLVACDQRDGWMGS